MCRPGSQKYVRCWKEKGDEIETWNLAKRSKGLSTTLSFKSALSVLPGLSAAKQSSVNLWVNIKQCTFHKLFRPLQKGSSPISLFYITEEKGEDQLVLSTYGLLTGIRAWNALFWYIKNSIWEADEFRQFLLPAQVEWDLRGSQAALSIPPSYANVPISQGSECPVWACQNTLTKPVLTIFGGSGCG